MRRHRLLPALILTALTLAACGGGREREPLFPSADQNAGTPAATAAVTPAPASPTPAPQPAPVPTESPAERRLATMTVEQKVGQLLVAGIEGVEAGEDARQAIEEYQVGGIILFGYNVDSAQQLTGLTNRLKALNGDYIPLFLCVDEEGGLVSRMPPEVADVPQALDFGQTGDSTLCARLGRLLGAECAAFGLNVNCAPCLDIWSNPDNTVIGGRALGTDPAAVSRLGSALWEGITDRGVIPVAKHFPGHGDTAADSHVGLPVVEKSLEELRRQELLPFQTAIDRGIPAIMVAHIVETSLDGSCPASLSPKVVDGLLRREMGFQGVVFTDDLTMAAVADTYDMGTAAVLAVEAGCDVLLICSGEANLTAAYESILAAVEEGRIPESRLDESVQRILTLKYQTGLSNEPVGPADVETVNAQIRALLALLSETQGQTP
ncbi:beta-N-acetylhexosaminidase [Pseudoflavonifractor sp. 524-17]|uniref:beta-N-acetylhexosaminidase n=1 Tax=Pseudoflavonifractor sp. 524-17 TaxID=2304577 RepID=UPI00325B57D7